MVDHFSVCCIYIYIRIHCTCIYVYIYIRGKRILQLHMAFSDRTVACSAIAAQRVARVAETGEGVGGVHTDLGAPAIVGGTLVHWANTCKVTGKTNSLSQ